MVSSTVDDCLQRQMAQNILKSKIKACPVNAGHYMAFNIHLQLIWLQTLVAIESESCQSLPNVVSQLLRAAI